MQQCHAPDGNSHCRSIVKGTHCSANLSIQIVDRFQVFPAERDAFSDLEDALAAAVQLHVERAKSLVKKDRAAAAKEVKR